MWTPNGWTWKVGRTRTQGCVELVQKMGCGSDQNLEVFH